MTDDRRETQAGTAEDPEAVRRERDALSAIVTLIVEEFDRQVALSDPARRNGQHTGHSPSMARSYALQWQRWLREWADRA